MYTTTTGPIVIMMILLLTCLPLATAVFVYYRWLAIPERTGPQKAGISILVFVLVALCELYLVMVFKQAMEIWLITLSVTMSIIAAAQYRAYAKERKNKGTSS